MNLVLYILVLGTISFTRGIILEKSSTCEINCEINNGFSLVQALYDLVELARDLRPDGTVELFESFHDGTACSKLTVALFFQNLDNFKIRKKGVWLSIVSKGHIDVGDGCWRPNVLVTSLRCW